MGVGYFRDCRPAALSRFVGAKLADAPTSYRLHMDLEDAIGFGQ
jgi:hypothetical protein